MAYQWLSGGISAVDGFLSSGVAADIKGNNADKKDIAIIYSLAESSCAGVYTQNKYCAAPVSWCKNIS
ncbi:MAG: bifunctional ornithine acetyltransferase/N-acetylglutamate synthase, partial [Clostridiales bacterium]